MTSFRKLGLALILLAFISLSACREQPAELTPINPDTDATFRIHAVMYDANGELARRPQSGAVLGVDVEQYTDLNGETLIAALPAIVDESCLEAISTSVDFYSNDPVLNFKLDAECSKIFAQYTARHINKQMAIIVNGEFMSAPNIRASITAGRGFVESNFKSLEEAEAIANTFLSTPQ